MKKRLFALVMSGIVLILPAVILAVNFPPRNQGVQQPNVPNALDAVINIIWQIFLGFSILMFIVAGFMFLAGRGDPAKMTVAKQMVIYGVIGIIVGILAFSIGGIINTVIFGS